MYKHVFERALCLFIILLVVKLILEVIDLKNRLNIIEGELNYEIIDDGKSNVIDIKQIEKLIFDYNDLKKRIVIIEKKQTKKTKKTKIELIETNKELSNVKIFDLSKNLTPSDLYDQIQCRKSAEIIVSTTLCVHDLSKDVYVSASIWQNGVWEQDLISSFMNYIKNNPDWLVLDVGAQIGQYSLFAAKLGRKVITVEPFYDNILRLHKAAFTEGISNNIILIKNAISNVRNEIKMLQPNSNNIGGQSLYGNKDKIFTKDEKNKYLVETILFDDIIDYIPKTSDNKNFKKAILKIDIEGFEPFAFQSAKKLFDYLEIPIIFMEWGNLPLLKAEYPRIEELLDFLYGKNLSPYRNGLLLERKDWINWPMDILWKKNGY